jgi:hypothetical protein
MWLRLGHACVIAGDGISRDVLVKLAAWDLGGSVRF